MIRIWAILLLGCITGITVSDAYIKSQLEPAVSGTYDYELWTFSGKVIAYNKKEKVITIQGKSSFFNATDVQVAFVYNRKTHWIEETTLSNSDYLIGLQYAKSAEKNIKIGDEVQISRTNELSSLLESITIMKEQEV